nr:G protein-coupled receptor [Proales similis]
MNSSDAINAFVLTLGQPIRYQPFISTLTVGLQSIYLALGFSGNLLILLGILLNPTLISSPPFILIFNACLTELILTLTVCPVVIISVFIGEEVMLARPCLCSLLASLSVILGIFYMSITFLICLNRYFLVKHPHRYRLMFTQKSTWLLCMSIWAFAILMELANRLAGAKYKFNQKLYLCLSEAAEKNRDSLSLLAFLGPPILANGVLYLSIFCHVRRSERRTKLNRALDLHSDSNRLIKSMFYQYLLYTVTWLPLTIVLVLQLDILTGLAFLLLCFANLHLAVNPILITCYNYRLRSSLRSQVKSWLRST